MCSIANPFDANIRKFDAKKHIFFPECSEYFSWKSKALNLRQPKLSASYKESVIEIFQSVDVTFLTWKS